MARKKMYKKTLGFDEYLRSAYCDDKRTMQDIANELGCSAATVLHHLRRCGIESRNKNEYEITQKQREAGRRVGALRKGVKLTDAQKAAISKINFGKRKRDDYEFGGHEKKRDDGYISVYCPDHPNSNKEGYVMKHRLVMERDLGIQIPDGYVVHHVNHIRDDNRIDNLALMTFKAHASLHMTERMKERRSKNEP